MPPDLPTWTVPANLIWSLANLILIAVIFANR